MSDQSADGGQSWVYDDGYGYDPDRWDPDARPSKCQVCGSWLNGAGDRATVGQHCTECDVVVWVR